MNMISRKERKERK